MSPSRRLKMRVAPTPSPPTLSEANVEAQLAPLDIPETSAPLSLISSPLDLLVEAISNVPSISLLEPSTHLLSPSTNISLDPSGPWEDFHQAFHLVGLQDSRLSSSLHLHLLLTIILVTRCFQLPNLPKLV